MQAEREAAAAPLADLSPSLFDEGLTRVFGFAYVCQCGHLPAHVLQLPVELSCACPVSGRCLLRWLERRGTVSASGGHSGSSGGGSARPADSAAAESVSVSSSGCPCPGCGDDIAADVRAWQTSRTVSRQLARQTAGCVNRAAGCHWGGAFGVNGAGLRAHLAQCAFTQQPCAHCAELVIRADMDEHLATRCTKHMRQSLQTHARAHAHGHAYTRGHTRAR